MNPITPSQMQKEDPLKIPVVKDNTDYSSLLNDSLSAVQNDYATVQAKQKIAEKNQVNTTGEIDKVLSYLSGKEDYTSQAQTDAGVDTEKQNLLNLSEQLGGLNAQASTLQREAEAVPIQIQQESAWKGLTKAGVAPIVSARLRENALKSLSIAQQSDIAQAALTGSQTRLALAQDKAQKNIDLKYKPQETKLATLQEQYKANKDYLERIDKNLADAFSNKLKVEEERIKTAKENEQSIQKLIVNASSQGAGADLVQRASQAKDPMSAAMILGQYAGDYLKTQKLKAEIQKIRGTSVSGGAGSGSVATASPTTLSNGKPASTTALNYLAQINSGVSFDDVMKNIGTTQDRASLRDEVVDLYAKQGNKPILSMDSKQISSIQANIETIDELTKGKIKRDADGNPLKDKKGNILRESPTYGAVSGTLQIGTPLTGQKGDALSLVDNLISQGTLQSLADAKANGVTFGALSGPELIVASGAASRLASRVMRDKDGNVTGFKGSEKGFLDDIKIVRDNLQKSIQTKTGGANTTNTTGNTAANTRLQALENINKDNGLGGYEGVK